MLVYLYPRENERRESFIAVHVIRAHLLPPSSAIQREERAREGGIVVVSRGEEGESDPEKTTAKKRGLLQYYCSLYDQTQLHVNT
jgi:hypothetical protein